MHISGPISRSSTIPAALLGAICLAGPFGGLAHWFTRWRAFSLDYFRSVKARAVTAMARHALARGVENAFARFRVLREGSENHPLDDGEVRARIPVVASDRVISPRWL